MIRTIKPLAFILISALSINYTHADQNDEKCFETSDGLEICMKQKNPNTNSIFTQKDADELAQSLPKMSSKQIAALQLLLQSQQGKKISTSDVQELAESLPKLPDAYVQALALYLQSNKNGTANPKEVEQVLTEIFNIPPQYQNTLQSGLKMIAEKDPAESDIIGLVNQLLKANDVPEEFGNTLQSYFTMIKQDDNTKAEEQFMKAGIGLLKLIIKASKDDDPKITNNADTKSITP